MCVHEFPFHRNPKDATLSVIHVKRQATIESFSNASSSVLSAFCSLWLFAVWWRRVPGNFASADSLKPVRIWDEEMQEVRNQFPSPSSSRLTILTMESRNSNTSAVIDPITLITLTPTCQRICASCYFFAARIAWSKMCTNTLFKVKPIISVEHLSWKGRQARRQRRGCKQQKSASRIWT